MKKRILFLALSLFPFTALAGEVTELSKTMQSWDGQPTAYPKGMAEITAIKIVLKPGDKMPFHCHPVPIVGYVNKGTLQVELKDGRKHVFNAGDTINEVSNTWHRGVNLSDKEEVELIGFYIGVNGTPNTIMYSEATKDACK